MEITRPIKKIKLRDVVIGIIFVLSLISGTGIISQTVLSLGVACCCAYLMFADELIFAFPFIMFYNDFFGLVFGLSVLRIFTFMLVFRALINMSGICKVRLQCLIPILVYFLFFALVISGYSIRRSIFGFLDVVCCSLLVIEMTQDEEQYKSFFRIFTYVALCAFVTGSLVGNVEMQGFQYTFEISRFNATFEDSNYMGFFYNVAIFSNVVLKLFKPKLRIIIVLLLEVMLMASISMTAIIANILLWTIYLLIAKKVSIKTVLVVTVIIFIAMGAYTYGLDNPETPIIGMVSYRINDKLSNVNDIDAFTTNRTFLAEQNFEYFKGLPLYKRVFGGTSVNPVYLDPDLRAASHNEYIDMLLNVGYIGTALMLTFVLWRTCNIWSAYSKTKSEVYLHMFMNKLIWLGYGLTLTMFTDYRFLFFFMM